MKPRTLVCAVMVFGAFTFGGANSGGEKKQAAAQAAGVRSDNPVKAKGDEDNLAKLGKARRDAAQKAYKTWLKQVGGVGQLENENPISVMTYELSIRFLNAELDLAQRKEERIAAHAAHLERMNGWYKAWDGLVGAERLALPLVGSFQKEAEFWLAREKSGKRQAFQ
jgi:hypothetical protein